MSLLIDVLRKFKDNARKTSVHPVIAKGKGSGETLKRKAFIFLTPLVLVSAVGAYFLTQLVVGSFEPAPVRQMPIEQLQAKVPEEPREPLVEEPPPKSKPQEVAPEKPKPAPRQVKTRVREPVRSNVNEEPVEKLVGELKEPRPAPKPALNLNSLLYEADRSFREGDLRRSAELYEKALSLKPLESAVNNLLVTYARLGEFAKAEELLRRFPEERFLYSYLVELTKNGRLNIALKLSKKFLHLDRKGYVHFARGYVYERLGRVGDALAEYRRAYEKNPADPYLAYNYARLLESAGMYREAYRLYEKLKSLELEPNLKDIVERRLRYLKFMGF
ncbi:tetratricopeptide repeat protein [Hydrogenivirga sp. 128-5-R1-1]|uniref:tetratricopeptide repeat protein n=1 Tax=Hydrogenivirga sp. 128-5-R1-1 TaxID=392423 RepID=UPI00015F3686|nr:tetratricopeptide repeat protein [Hydrogenivirga sp. 128-5-R1-1]EDP76667.1 hypothetical protein HG1285_03633 [Hydrogenivirga sp. 128-5-R1-1]